LVDLIIAKQAGSPTDEAALAQRVSQAVTEVVQKQADVGVDVLNDGEQSKAGYATYVMDRMTGFGGDSPALPRSDWADFPEAHERIMSSLAVITRPACNGPVDSKGGNEVQTDISNLKAGMSAAKSEEAFMTAASPGVIALFLVNQHYPSREAYMSVLVDLMKVEYKAIVDAGFLLQVDCPDLAMGRHMEWPTLSNSEFLKVAEANVEALNAALEGLPSDRMRLHLCWGNYEGPHHLDIPLKEILPIALKARPDAISFEGSNPRHEHEWNVFEDVKLPDGKVIIPGVVDSTTNFIEHPELVSQRIVRYAKLVGRENVIAGSDCGFGTFVRTNPTISPELVWPKLEAMAEGARLATKELW
jgi:5-methyltetrahydropteroyltriglutamate--homocysteine methyltransferase